MYHPSAAAWVGIIVVVLAALSGVVAWAIVARRHHQHPSGLSATLLDDYPDRPTGGAVAIAYLNIRLANDSDRPVVIDGLGYRRAGLRRLIPIRRFDAPAQHTLDEMADTLLPPPYRLLPGESQVITLYAPALCSAQELAGLYFHTSEGELLWLPRKELDSLTRTCNWLSE